MEKEPPHRLLFIFWESVDDHIGNGLSIAGGAPGINATLDWDTQEGYVVIALANFDPPAAGNVARQIPSWLPE